jgi:glycosyltransferase involved in cell wall biosynthesis
MRVLQIGPIPPEVGGTTCGGVASHLWSLATHLAAYGHRVGILADNFSGSSTRHTTKQAVEIYGAGSFVRNVQPHNFLLPAFWAKIVRAKSHFRSTYSWHGVMSGIQIYQSVLERFNPDVIHIHHLETRFTFACISTKGAIPLVTTVHSTHSIDFSESPKRNLNYQLVQRNLDLADNLVFVSRFLRKRFEEFFPGKLRKIMSRVIPNPLDSTRYFPVPKEKAREKLGWLPDEVVILFVGNLIPRKGAGLLFEAAIILLQTFRLKFRLVLVGDGPQKSNLEDLISRYDLQSTVNLEGVKPPCALPDYYSAADLFVLPSAMESFGLVFIEAMLCGCPVIGTPEVLDELLLSDACGFRVPDRDAFALAQSIKEALGRNWDREEIRHYALSYDWKTKIQDFIQIYHEISDSKV